MKMIHIFLALSLSVGISMTTDAQIKSDSGFVTESVTVKGKIKNPMVLTVESLQKMKVVNGKGVNIICQSGAHKKTIKTFKAVLLRTILDSAAINMDRKKDRGKFVIVVTASDNYKVVFSYNEIYFGAAGDNIYVAFEENGHTLTEEGKIIIFCASDLVSGPRHVKWVKTIEVKEIE